LINPVKTKDIIMAGLDDFKNGGDWVFYDDSWTKLTWA
jgi:hypothetical protein